MARFSSTNNSLHLNVYIDQASQNIAGNTSTVSWRVTVSRTGAYRTWNQSGDSTLSVTIDGRQIHASNPRWETSGEEAHLASGSHTVGHNPDGSKSVSISADFNPNNGLHGRMITSGSLGLTPIPRSSSVSVGAGTIGSSITITINRQSSSFKHTVRYAWGNKSGTIASNVDTSTVWTIPLDFASDIPNATSGTGTIYVDTYSGATKTGTQSATFSASVPDSVKPSLTGFTLTDNNTAASRLIPGGQQFIQIISNIAVHFGQATGMYGSTITGYYAEIVGKNQSTNINGGSLGIMNYHGAITIRARVTDSRGRTSNTIERTVTVLEYFAPALNFGVERSGATSSTFTVNRNARIAPLTVNGSQKNAMTLSFKVARLGTTNYTVDTGSAAGTWTTLASLINSKANLSGNYAANQSWVVIGTLEDKFTRTEFAVNVATESVVFSYDRQGVGVNKIRERGALDVRGDSYFDGHLFAKNDSPIGHYSRGGAVADLDAIIVAGVHTFNAQTANQPNGLKSWGVLEVLVSEESRWNGTNNWIWQTYISTEDHIFKRKRINAGKWSAWVDYKSLANHPMLQEKPLKILTMGFPYSLNATLTRKDSLVTITLNRRVTNVDTFEYKQMTETIPLGYRPAAEAHMTIVPNVNATTKAPSVLHFAPNGVIRFTNSSAGQSVYTGTVTYITNDPYPS
ncbi:DUF859 family phage minor structural protein [Streptococcus ruminantium]|uniref:DUF859 family phage minor structural protein n=1 Tax=Streptococcus ruminantium TaxID=1917441 RepID=UPI0012DCA51E|nr:DUF859 family phage minor structural protein [Streptococcus ruminantium]